MKEFKGIKIGKHYIEKPLVQGGMGVGLSWDQLAGNVIPERMYLKMVV